MQGVLWVCWNFFLAVLPVCFAGLLTLVVESFRKKGKKCPWFVWLPIGVWILMRLFSALPEDVLDAARVDGSGDLGVLWRIVMPLSLPGIVAVGVVAFFFSWNEYLFTSTLITDTSSMPASVGIATLISQLDSPVQQLLAAGIMFAILPVLFYLSVQRLIVAGLTAGAVKG